MYQHLEVLEIHLQQIHRLKRLVVNNQLVFLNQLLVHLSQIKLIHHLAVLNLTKEELSIF